MVHRELIHSGQWPQELGSSFDLLTDLRETGDYGGMTQVSPESRENRRREGRGNPPRRPAELPYNGSDQALRQGACGPDSGQSLTAGPKEGLQDAMKASCAFGTPIAKLSGPPGGATQPHSPGPWPLLSRFDDLLAAFLDVPRGVAGIDHEPGVADDEFAIVG